MSSPIKQESERDDSHDEQEEIEDQEEAEEEETEEEQIIQGQQPITNADITNNMHHSNVRNTAITTSMNSSRHFPSTHTPTHPQAHIRDTTTGHIGHAAPDNVIAAGGPNDIDTNEEDIEGPQQEEDEFEDEEEEDADGIVKTEHHLLKRTKAEQDDPTLLDDLRRRRKRRKDLLDRNIPDVEDDDSKRKYELIIAQQPRQARMCGLSEKDRRLIDPPPIVQCLVTDTETGNLMIPYMNLPHLVVHVTLWSLDRKLDLTVGGEILGLPKPGLMGTMVASNYVLLDMKEQNGIFFVFSDLSARNEGVFRLKFSLIRLGDPSSEVLPDPGAEWGRHVCHIFSEPFRVYPPKDFPGMSESTNISIHFANQGIRIPTRKETRKKLAMMELENSRNKVDDETQEEEA